MTNSLITGIHHVTAIAKDPRANLAFYTRTLGLRLVKRTVNFDDPFTYHLYYGDEGGTPGTLLTHFPNPAAKRGVHGSPEIVQTVLAVAGGSLAGWRERLRRGGVAIDEIGTSDGARLIFEDQDGMRFAAVESSVAQRDTNTADCSDGEIVGIHAVVVHVPDADQTARFLTETLGFEIAGRSGFTTVLHLAGGGTGRIIELIETPTSQATAMGAGTVHHVAWRVPDDEAQAEVARRLGAAGVASTPQLDRQYFRSIYARIPGGVIFEIATDGPGFDADEPVSELGSALKLPPRHEPRRAEIEARLVPLDID